MSDREGSKPYDRRTQLRLVKVTQSLEALPRVYVWREKKMGPHIQTWLLSLFILAILLPSHRLPKQVAAGRGGPHSEHLWR